MQANFDCICCIIWNKISPLLIKVVLFISNLRQGYVTAGVYVFASDCK